MKEIEILVEVRESKESALKKLQRFKHAGTVNIQDTYYYDPRHKEQFIDENDAFKRMFRVRRKGDKAFLTYKEDHFEEEEWLYADEWETRIDDPAIMQSILEHLGYEALVVVNNTREVFITEDYEIVLEDVKDLGLFLEVEALSPKDDARIVRERIFSLLSSLEMTISGESKAGKAELLYAKKLGKNV